MLSTINNKDMRHATKQTPEQRIKQKLAIQVAGANVSSSIDDEMIMVPKEDDGEGTSGLEMQRPANNTPQAQAYSLCSAPRVDYIYCCFYRCKAAMTNVCDLLLYVLIASLLPPGNRHGQNGLICLI
jgi:hypothetical protein